MLMLPKGFAVLPQSLLTQLHEIYKLVPGTLTSSQFPCSALSIKAISGFICAQVQKKKKKNRLKS